MKFSRGLTALILTLVFQTTLTAEYLYKDDVVNNPKFNEEVNKLGKEVYEKTGISIKLVMIRDLPHTMDITQYEEEIMKDFTKPTILLTFAELNSQVNITVNESSLYKHFNRNQVLSPVASSAQALVIAIFYSDNFETFKSLLQDSGGTILPLLGSKAKSGEITSKYASAMFNGYIDVARQVAESKGVTLDIGTGKSSVYVMLAVKVLFYGVLLMALVMYIRKKLYKRRNK
ncbi:3-dehydroquinate dehydratase [Sulfurimonas sp. SAG-AH-194-I05]|nr:3-dehydroquinate dehydratase [Sulfurimonas sp. SAG-AH-194-I05]MDF1874147.1 3-dehydroquinate dehydratase [Sulfurimonas sp. SAG-AH-194-I05]